MRRLAQPSPQHTYIHIKLNSTLITKIQYSKHGVHDAEAHIIVCYLITCCWIIYRSSIQYNINDEVVLTVKNVYGIHHFLCIANMNNMWWNVVCWLSAMYSIPNIRWLFTQISWGSPSFSGDILGKYGLPNFQLPVPILFHLNIH